MLYSLNTDADPRRSQPPAKRERPRYSWNGCCGSPDSSPELFPINRIEAEQYRRLSQRPEFGAMASDGMDYTRPTRSEKNQSAALEGVNGAVGIRNGVQCANFVV